MIKIQLFKCCCYGSIIKNNPDFAISGWELSSFTWFNLGHSKSSLIIKTKVEKYIFRWKINSSSEIKLKAPGGCLKTYWIFVIAQSKKKKLKISFCFLAFKATKLGNLDLSVGFFYPLGTGKRRKVWIIPRENLIFYRLCGTISCRKTLVGVALFTSE